MGELFSKGVLLEEIPLLHFILSFILSPIEILRGWLLL